MPTTNTGAGFATYVSVTWKHPYNTRICGILPRATGLVPASHMPLPLASSLTQSMKQLPLITFLLKILMRVAMGPVTFASAAARLFTIIRRTRPSVDNILKTRTTSTMTISTERDSIGRSYLHFIWPIAIMSGSSIWMIWRSFAAREVLLQYYLRVHVEVSDSLFELFLGYPIFFDSFDLRYPSLFAKDQSNLSSVLYLLL